jgi:predicted nuclease of predicted toxin-antitoxin system
MRILANENFPGEAVQALRSRGHDVIWVRTDSPGSSDDAVSDRAVAENRLLITFDKDFGEMAFRRELSSPAGIVLFRVRASSPARVAQLAVAILESRTDWSGHFSVIEEDRIRMAPLPTAKPR